MPYDPKYYYGQFRQSLQEQERPADNAPIIYHTVEDSRRPGRSTPTAHASSPQNRPSTPTKRRARHGRRALTVLCVICLIGCLAALIADFFLPNGVLGYLSQAFAPQPRYIYALSQGSYDTNAQAQVAAEGIQSQGGAGFILFDGHYHVLVCAYPTQEEAQAVADKTKYTLYPLLAQPVSAGDFPLAYRSKADGIVDYPLQLFDELYRLSSAVQAAGATMAYARNQIASLRQTLDDKTASFLSATADSRDAFTLGYRGNIMAILAAMDNLCDETITPDGRFLADLRWTAILVIRLNRP